MNAVAPLRTFAFPFPSRNGLPRPKSLHKSARIRTCCAPIQSQSVDSTDATVKSEYKPGIFDDLLLAWFRSKMVQAIGSGGHCSLGGIFHFIFGASQFIHSAATVQDVADYEVGWNSEKTGYDGLMEVVNRLMMKGQTNKETEHAAVRVLRSLFPPFLVELFRTLIAPIGGGKLAAMMVARVTALSCQWLMGPCRVNSIELPNGSSSRSGVFVERCKYLEESKCVGICINTCKLPTQTFFSDHMGVPLLMEPNFRDYSCQFSFGVHPSAAAEDKILREPCLEICPNATRRRKFTQNVEVMQCPKA